MIRNIKRTWFEVWGTEVAQNHFLKTLLVLFIILTFGEAVVLTVLALRKLPIVAVSSTESRILTIQPPRKELLEFEIQRAVSGYMRSHYNWEWNKIDESFKDASKYVSPEFVKGFISANEAQARIAKEKKISQKLYIAESTLDLKNKSVKVLGDRIIIVEGLRATNPLSIEVQYDFAERTETNPEGVYITGEKVLTNEGGNR